MAEQVRSHGSEALVVQADFTGSGAPAEVVARTTETLRGLDVLVNNAGNVRAARLEQVSEEEVLTQVALNLTAPVLLTRAALPALRASGEGLVVVVSSATALVGLPFYATYPGHQGWRRPIRGVASPASCTAKASTC